MGQGLSRSSARARPTSVIGSDEFNAASTSASPVDAIPAPLPTVARRRKSMRKSLLNLVKPSSASIRSRSGNAETSSSRKTRTASSKTLQGSSAVESSSQDTVSNPETPPIPTVSEKGKERATDDAPSVDIVPDSQDDHTPMSSTPLPSNPAPSSPYESLTREADDCSPNTGSLSIEQEHVSAAAASAHSLGISGDDSQTETEGDVAVSPDIGNAPPDAREESVHGPSLDPSYSTPDVDEAPSSPAEQSDTHTPPRQFPPPGTLVVVQGVVHTTDVPRPAASDAASSPNTTSIPIPAQETAQRRASSAPRPSTPSGVERGSTRDRLAALIRPASLRSPRTSSPERVSHDANLISHTAEAITSADETTATASPQSANLNTIESAASTAPQAAASADNSRGQGAISSSSIDVLGTLLSVAAAATAASLLTGSSEHMLSAGSPSTDGANPSTTPQSRPTSPTPTAGLGDVLGTGTSSPAHGRGDRMRQAWGSIRERLGLGGPGAGSDNDSAARSTRPDGTPMDAREIMLAEMTRAFNLGLGLTNDNTGEARSRPGEAQSHSDQTATTDPSTPTATTSESPAEGSFERFLIDLQADLRVALTLGAGNGEEGDASSGTPAPTNQPASSANTASSPAGRTSQSISSIFDAPWQTDDTHDDMPALEDVSDSDSDDDEEDESDDGSNEISETEMPGLAPIASTTPEPPTGDEFWTPAAPPTSVEGSPSTQSGRNINWWRLYRFPPITAPGHMQWPASFPATPAPRSTEAAPQTDTPSDNPFVTNPIHADTPAEPTSTPPPLPETPSNIVYPVIVVGLQSVGLRRRGVRPASDVAGGADDAAITEDDMFDDFVPEGTDGDADAPRGRPWRSRAASAIRNLRPGRRPAPDGAEAAEAIGSRTFLIYVIGGYYPPEHSIVTGGPNNLGSFEALLELAEMLGQVKPPTVSKEEIDRSGLEIIRAARLREYEDGGKISSNCTERCLICLDDYEPEEDVRVLSCRHAFHKNCVDKWLQTGKNNCPACRSKGVATDGQSSTATDTQGN